MPYLVWWDSRVPISLMQDSSDGRTLTPLPLNADDSKSLKDMRKKTFRKYLRKLKTEADKEEARALRSKQVCCTLHQRELLRQLR